MADVVVTNSSSIPADHPIQRAESPSTSTALHQQIERKSIEEILGDNDVFYKLLKATGDETSNYVEMLLLPVLTSVSGLMAKSTVYTQRQNFNFKQPNNLWSCVAAEPGSKKSVALSAICDGLKALEKELQARLTRSQSTPLTQTTPHALSSKRFTKNKLFAANETITTAKLHDELYDNDGVYLTLFDEIDWLFEAVDGKCKPDSLDRRIWLSLYGGGSKSRNTIKSKHPDIEHTRLNYTGYIQPSLLRKRLRLVNDEESDGFWERHMMCLTDGRSLYFDDIGDIVPDGENLCNLFTRVYDNHHPEMNTENHYDYKLNHDAGELFIAFFNANVDTIDAIKKIEGRPHIGIFNKNPGLVLRLSMVLEAVFNALNATGDADNVAKTVTKHSVEIAIELVKWLNCQRFDLMGETGPQVPNEVLHGDSIDATDMAAGEFTTASADTLQLVIRRLAADSKEIIDGRAMNAKKCLPKNSKGVKENTMARTNECMVRLSQLGFCDLIKHKRSYAIKKRPREEMAEPVQKIMRRE